jgi:co-chaperonin GroES (HSP10)
MHFCPLHDRVVVRRIVEPGPTAGLPLRKGEQ